MPDKDDNFRQGVAKYKEANDQRDLAQYSEAERLYAEARALLKDRLEVPLLCDMAKLYDFSGKTEEATLLYQQCFDSYKQFKRDQF